MGQAVDRLIVKLAGPADEARDDHGRWTSSGSGFPSKAEVAAKVSAGEQQSIDNTARAYGEGSPQHQAAIAAAQDRASKRERMVGLRKPRKGHYVGLEAHPARSAWRVTAKAQSQVGKMGGKSTALSGWTDDYNEAHQLLARARALQNK